MTIKKLNKSDEDEKCSETEPNQESNEEEHFEWFLRYGDKKRKRRK